MNTRDVYLESVLQNAPRLLGLLNRNHSSSSFGSFDREFWHYNTVDFSCARKQEAVLTLTLLYLIKDERNRYYRSTEILGYIKGALEFWTGIQNKNGSFNEWYPSEHSFVVTSFSTYAVSESLLLIKSELTESEFQKVIKALVKAGDWLAERHEIRVMNQQTGAAIALLNLYLLTNENKYLSASKDKVALLHKRQSEEGWFLEYGGPDIGYLSLAIDYLCKYYSKTKDVQVKEIIDRALGFIQYFIQPNLVAGGEYTSRNTEYLIPHGFETYSKVSKAAGLIASMVRKSLQSYDSFPNLFDDRYLTYVGYTWLQAYQDANPELDETTDNIISDHFSTSYSKNFAESGLLIRNDNYKYLVVNVKKGGSFRLYDKKTGRSYSDSGILVSSDGKWYTSGWLAETEMTMGKDHIEVSGTMWKVPDKTLSPLSNVMLRLFQLTLGRSSFISLWMKERLRDLLITKTKPSSIRYNRKMRFEEGSSELIKITDSISAEESAVSSMYVYAKDTHIYVPSSRYFCELNEEPYYELFADPVKHAEIEWGIIRNTGPEFNTNK